MTSRSRSKRGSEAKPVNTILSQDPEEGKAEKGSSISVTAVGTQVADVPNVARQNSGSAQQNLKEAGFEVAVQKRESTFEEEDLGFTQQATG